MVPMNPGPAGRATNTDTTHCVNIAAVTPSSIPNALNAAQNAAAIHIQRSNDHNMALNRATGRRSSCRPETNDSSLSTTPSCT
jgi:hypothetical protein